MEGYKPRARDEKPRRKPEKFGGRQNFTRAMLLAALAAFNPSESATAQGLTSYDVLGKEDTQSTARKDAVGPAIVDAWSADVSTHDLSPQPVLIQDEQRLAKYLAMRETLKGFHVRFSGKEAYWPQYEEFCKDLAIFCEKFAHPSDQPQEREMSPETHARISDINREVAEEVIPEEDQKLYGVPEKWTIPGVAGDCEDLVILKMVRLIDGDIDPSRLHILVVKKKDDGAGHAVLGVDVLVNGRVNTLVLDNLTDEIVPIEKMEKVYDGVYASFVSWDENKKLKVRFFEYTKAAQ